MAVGMCLIISFNMIKNHNIHNYCDDLQINNYNNLYIK